MNYPYSWYPLIRISRAAVGILLLAGVGLALPSQTHDMLLALGQDSAGPLLALHGALFILAFSAWYWSRAVISATWEMPHDLNARDAEAQARGIPPAALTWLPRGLFIIVGLLGFGLLGLSQSWGNGIILLGWIALGTVLLYYRTQWFPGEGKAPVPPPAAPAGGWLRWLRHQLRHLVTRGRRLLRFAPFGPVVAAVLLIIDLLLFVLGVIEGVLGQPSWLPPIAAVAAGVFPGPAVAVFGLALMIGPLTLLTFALDHWSLRFNLCGLDCGLHHLPILSALGLMVFVVVPLWFHVHTVRLVDPWPPKGPGQATDPRATLAEYFKQWVKLCYPQPTSPLRPIIVASSGGATKAGMWTARVLYDIEDATGFGGPAVFAVSSVSGGSLGTAAYMAIQSGHNGPFCRQPASRGRADALDLGLLAPSNSLHGDALGPILGAWLFYDVPRALFAWHRLFHKNPARGGDSGEAFERALEGDWQPIANRIPGASRFDQSFLTLFYRDHAPRPGMPLWIGNGTEVTTGNRILTIPVTPGPPAAAPGDPTLAVTPREWPFRAAFDLLGLVAADVPISTGINNTARFPFLEPFGDVYPLDSNTAYPTTRAEVIDGGYFENEGLQTALELADWLRIEGSKVLGGLAVEPIIVEATADADPEVKTGDVVRCGGFRGDPRDPTASQHMDIQVLAPLLGVYNVRGGHSAALLRQAREQYCGAGGPRFFHFYLPGAGEPQIPLNWLLSNTAARRIWESTKSSELENARELQCMQSMLRRWTSEARPQSEGTPPACIASGY
jgi:hypothetical protein